jgi:hypothetical protein
VSMSFSIIVLNIVLIPLWKNKRESYLSSLCVFAWVYVQSKFYVVFRVAIGVFASWYSSVKWLLKGWASRVQFPPVIYKSPMCVFDRLHWTNWPFFRDQVKEHHHYLEKVTVVECSKTWAIMWC